MVDNAPQDTGAPNVWSLDITRCTTHCGRPGPPRTHAGETGRAIPDAGTLESRIEVTDAGQLQSLHVDVEITHSFPYELTLRLRGPSGREFVLLTEDPSSTSRIERSFEVTGFVGEELRGTWTLTVTDGASGDTGTLDAWRLRASTR